MGQIFDFWGGNAPSLTLVYKIKFKKMDLKKTRFHIVIMSYLLELIWCEDHKVRSNLVISFWRL